MSYIRVIEYLQIKSSGFPWYNPREYVKKESCSTPELSFPVTVHQ
jgi:hypothetical protein